VIVRRWTRATVACASQAHAVVSLPRSGNFDWDDARRTRSSGRSAADFEDVVFHIARGDLLDILEHTNPDRAFGQRISVSDERSTYLVPFPPSLRQSAPRAEAGAEDEHTVFLNPTVPSWNATKHYLGEGADDED
jgi:hypothetical protein